MQKLAQLLHKLGNSGLVKKIAENPKTSAGIAVGAPVAAYGAGVGAKEGMDQYKDLKRKELILQNLGKGAAMGGAAGLGVLLPKLLDHPTTKRFLGLSEEMSGHVGKATNSLSPEDMKRIKALLAGG
jgi:hypothetical protein